MACPPDQSGPINKPRVRAGYLNVVAHGSSGQAASRVLARVCRGVMGQAVWLFPVPPGPGSAMRQGLTSEAEGAEPSWA